MSLLSKTTSADAEKSLLGCVMANPALLDDLSDLDANLFYYPDHRLLWKTVCKLKDADTAIVPLAIKEAVSDAEWQTIGAQTQYPPAYYIQSIIDDTPGYMLAYAETYGEILKEMQDKRQLELMANTIGRGIVEGLPATEILEKAQESLVNIQVGRVVSIPPTYSDIMKEYYNDMENLRTTDSPPGIPTPWPDLDKKLDGLVPGEVTIVACRPGMGKSAVLLQIAIEAAKKKYKVRVDSLEMSNKQLAGRSVSQEIGLSKDAQKSLTDEQWAKFVRFVGEADQQFGKYLYIEDGNTFNLDGQLSPSILRAQAFRQKQQVGLDLLILDYIQLMESDGSSRNNNRVNELGKITRAIKQLAMALNIPIVVAAQLSRAVENRQDKRPMLSDLRESGSLEQDADNVIFIYRDGYYNENPDSIEPSDNIAEFILAKHRNGPTGTVSTVWRREQIRFDPISTRHIDLSMLNGSAEDKPIRRHKPSPNDSLEHVYRGK